MKFYCYNFPIEGLQSWKTIGYFVLFLYQYLHNKYIKKMIIIKLNAETIFPYIIKTSKCSIVIQPYVRSIAQFNIAIIIDTNKIREHTISKTIVIFSLRDIVLKFIINLIGNISHTRRVLLRTILKIFLKTCWRYRLSGIFCRDRRCKKRIMILFS